MGQFWSSIMGLSQVTVTFEVVVGATARFWGYGNSVRPTFGFLEADTEYLSIWRHSFAVLEQCQFIETISF
jgi:hypothetical protein